VWRKQGETAAKYLSRGSQVAISGQIQIRNYEAKDGTKRYVTEIIADEVQFLRSSNNEGEDAPKLESSIEPKKPSGDDPF
jgi:single-strand DNA-binding protein